MIDSKKEKAKRKERKKEKKRKNSWYQTLYENKVLKVS